MRGLEVDLAEAEGALDATGGDAAAELDEARKKVDALTALARRRGDALLAAEAEAAAAAAEVASLKRQLAAAADASLPRVRELEAMMAEMITAEGRRDGGEGARARDRHGGDGVAGGDGGARRVCAAVETRAADMVDAEELDAAEARADTLEKEANELRAKVRALEAEMASMSYDDEGAGSDAKGATAAAVAAFVAAPTTKRRETNTATTAPATGSTRKQAFTRTPGAFKKRTLKFSEVRAKAAPTKGFVRTPGTFTLEGCVSTARGARGRRTRRRPSPTASAARSSAPRARSRSEA